MRMETRSGAMTNAVLETTHISVLGSEVPENVVPGLTRQDVAQQWIRELATGQSSLEDLEVIMSVGD